MTAVEIFIQALRERGVTWMATLCGHGLNPFFYAAKNAGLRLIDTRNEQTAAYIADYFGRLTRRPGICAVSSGVAHANALTGVANAWFDRSPMLLVTGAGPHRTAGMGHFQDIDQPAIAAAVTKYSRTVDHPERVLQILDEAMHAALEPPPGPVHLTFPVDVQTAPVNDSNLVRPAPRPLPKYTADSEVVARALSSSERPLIIVGSDAYYNNSGPDLVRFAERFSIPVQTPIWDRGVFDRPSPAFIGVIGAASGGPALLQNADCVVLAGAEPDYRVGFLQPGSVATEARVVRLDSGWDRLTDLYGGPVHAAWLGEVRKLRREFRAQVEHKGAAQARAGLHAMHAVEAIRQVLTLDTLLLIDGGSIGQWAHQLLCDRYPGHWLTCGRSGVVGWGLGGAMAARLAYPDSPVLLLSGDGAFTFTVAEIECAVRQKLPFVAMVVDDQAWGITHAGHLREFGEGVSTVLGPIAFDRLAESLGARGRKALTPEQITAELKDALERPEVTVIHIPVVNGNPL